MDGESENGEKERQGKERGERKKPIKAKAPWSWGLILA